MEEIPLIFLTMALDIHMLYYSKFLAARKWLSVNSFFVGLEDPAASRDVTVKKEIRI
jgi:hypothetical protein